MQGMQFKIGLLKYKSALVDKIWKYFQTYGMITEFHPRSKFFGSFGQNSLIGFPQGTTFNENAIHIGANTMIGSNTTLSAGMTPGQDLLSNEIVKIGDNCLIGRGSHLIGHYHIEISDDVITGPYVYITDQNHGYLDPHTPIKDQDPTEKPVFIGPGCWIGTGAIILPGTYLGKNCVVAAGAVVNSVFGDNTIIAGIPGRAIKVFSNDSWQDMKKNG